MKKLFRRMTALLLSTLLLLGALPLAQADEAAEADAYREGVFQRYDDYYYGMNQYQHLQNTSNYAYCAWADDIESRGGVEHAFLWATNKLLGKALDTDAYIDYLSKILAMQEKGFVETLSAQAEYTMKASAVEQALKLGTVSFSAVLNTGVLESAAKNLKALGAGIDIIKCTANTVSDVSHALLLTHFSESYAQKLAFLEAVRDNTEDKKLEKAAEALIGTATLEFSYYVEQLTAKALPAYADFTLNIDGAYDFSGLLEAAATELADKFEPWAKFVLTGGKDMALERLGALPKAALFGAGKFVSAASYVKAGFAVGGAVMALFFADDVELFREMTAMDTIGNALSAALTDIENDISAGSGDKKYASIRDLVAAGQALCYVRLRGEYCAVESIRGKDGSPEDLDGIFSRTTDLLNRCHSALGLIFPEPERQIIVTAEEERTTEPNVNTSIAHVQIHVSNDPEIGEKITSSSALRDLYDSAYEERDNTITDGRLYGDRYAYDYTFKLFDAHATPGALSLQFMSASYYGGAHSISNRIFFTFDLETGEPLALNDLLNPENSGAEEALIRLFTDALRSEMPSLPSPETNIRSIFEYTEGYAYWGFTRDGLCISFAPYTIAAYAVGYIEALVPYDALAGLINPVYLPPDRDARSFSSACSGYTQAEAKSSGDYTNFYGTESAAGFAGDGDVLEVIAGSGYVSDYASYRDNVLFYASYMTAADFFWLPETEDGTFILEYTIKPENQNDGLLQTELLSVSGGDVTQSPITLTH